MMISACSRIYTITVTYPNILGPRGVQISETIQFVYEAERFPFNAQQNVYEYHYFGGSDK